MLSPSALPARRESASKSSPAARTRRVSACPRLACGPSGGLSAPPAGSFPPAGQRAARTVTTVTPTTRCSDFGTLPAAGHAEEKHFTNRKNINLFQDKRKIQNTNANCNHFAFEGFPQRSFVVQNLLEGDGGLVHDWEALTDDGVLSCRSALKARLRGRRGRHGIARRALAGFLLKEARIKYRIQVGAAVAAIRRRG